MPRLYRETYGETVVFLVGRSCVRGQMPQNFDYLFFVQLNGEFNRHLRWFFGANWDKPARDYDPTAFFETTLLNNLGMDGFTLKLGSFGKFHVRDKPGIRRKIGFSGETILTKALRKVKFITLANLRRQERVD